MKRGFTTVEVIITFAITIALAVMLFQIVVIMNDIYNINEEETEFLNDISLFSYDINRDLDASALTQISSCGSDCYVLHFLNGSTKELKIENNDIIYDLNKTDFDDNTQIMGFSINEIKAPSVGGNYDSMALIEIHLKNDYIKYDNTTKIVYQYNSTVSNVIYP